MTLARPPVSRGTCRYCGSPVIWGRLQNGRYMPFEIDPNPGIGAPGDLYAYSRRYGAVVDMVGVHNWPDELLKIHRCRAYLDSKNDIGGLGPAVEAILMPPGNNDTDRTNHNGST